MIRSDASAIVLEIIRGKLPLSSLHVAGITVKEDIAPEQHIIRFISDSKMKVYPSLKDLAQGLYRTAGTGGDTLRKWASFVLGAIDIIDLSHLEDSLARDRILGAIWDASFTGAVNEGDAEMIRSLVSSLPMDEPMG